MSGDSAALLGVHSDALPVELPAARALPAPGGIGRFIGVDGCRAGWIAVHLAPGAGPRWETVGTGGLGELRPDTGCALVLIDMPIGLPDGSRPVRGCEPEARRLLGARRSSVFSPPGRAALADASHAGASAANRRETGRGLSRQAWGIAPKIAALDQDLRTGAIDPAGLIVWEAHPELCWRAMNGGRPMTHWKRTRAGFRERTRLLNGIEPGLGGWIEGQTPRLRGSGAAPDDLVDALGLAIAACRGYPDGFRALPAKPERDALGVPMQMVYWQPTAGWRAGGNSRPVLEPNP